VHEHAVQSTLGIRKRVCALRADEYLKGHKEAAPHEAGWEMLVKTC
jgi:hypothetical protein